MNDDLITTLSGDEVVVYEATDGEVQVEVRLDGETVWLTQRQMGQVFETSPENVAMHLRNVFSSGELEESATTKVFLAVRTEGRCQVRRTLKHYNLDAIVSVGYRVNSKGLTALTLLIAESAPTGKDLMIRLIINLLADRPGHSPRHAGMAN